MSATARALAARLACASLALGPCIPAAPAGAGADRFTVVDVDTRTDDLRLFWADDAGRPYRRLARLAADVERHGQELVFAMNAGMFQADGAPVGLLVVDGVRVEPLNLAAGEGNFFLKPNGVFYVDAGGTHVVDAAGYVAATGDGRGVRLATQSGPLLLEHGRIHPALRAGSTSRLIRNGVCAMGRQAAFVISDVPVNFHEFATFLRDGLHCRDALYLDGVVSSLQASAQGRHDDRADLGPLVGVVRPRRAAAASAP